MSRNKRTKWTSISGDTKIKVYERDKGCCIFCGSPSGLPEMHIVSRANGGSGCEKNIVTACRYTCHMKMDAGTREERKLYREIAINYLKSKYDNWNEEDLIYKKGM